MTWVAVAAVAAALLLPLAAPALRPVGAAVGVPLYAAAGYLGRTLSPVAGYFSSKRSLAEENRQLRERVAALLAASIERDALRRGREELLAAVDFHAKEKGAVVVEVLARPPATAFDTLLVDQGEDDGLRLGAFAYAGSVPVGVVTRLSNGSAVVTLLSAADASLQVSISGRAVEAVGRGSGRFAAALPSQFAPATGTPVSTTDGAPLASVAAVVSGEGDGSVVALLVSPVDLSLVRYLTIAK